MLQEETGERNIFSFSLREETWLTYSIKAPDTSFWPSLAQTKVSVSLDIFIIVF